MKNNMHNNLQELYSHADNAQMMTVPQAREFLTGALNFGPYKGPDTTLYAKNDRWYQVIIPCLACLGKSKYDDTTPVVEIVEIDAEKLMNDY